MLVNVGVSVGVGPARVESFSSHAADARPAAIKNMPNHRVCVDIRLLPKNSVADPGLIFEEVVFSCREQDAIVARTNNLSWSRSTDRPWGNDHVGRND
jgi:hypothetical protein